ncbi:MAG: glutathione S-transferase family protein [Hyphomicrobiaceae bacterium]
MTGRLTLHHWAPSRSMTARWMLEEIGEPYDVVLVDIGAGEQLTPAYRSINPMGKVPTLVHGDSVVTETAAICCYLADAFPAAGLAPKLDDPARGPYLKWLFYMPSCMEPAIVQKAMGWPEGRRSTLGWGSLDDVVATLDLALDGEAFVVGDRFTAADVVVGAGIRWGLQFGLLPERESFRRYADKLGERPALQRQMAADQVLMDARTAS